jgi:hypothetical protein
LCKFFSDSCFFFKSLDSLDLFDAFGYYKLL